MTELNLSGLTREHLHAVEHIFRWQSIAHDHQIEPAGSWWDIWLMLAGRGAGKTRASAETLFDWAWNAPGTRWLAAAPTISDLRATCFEGESGLLNVIPPDCIQKTSNGGLWNSSEKELRLVNGSLIKGISAEEPERFRGPQFHGGWLDELCAWSNAQDAWDMIEYTMRLGQHPRLLVSTTPKPTPLIRDLAKRNGKDVAITTASTYANEKNLAPSFLKKLKEKEGTRLGRQEIYAEILDAEEGGIIKRKWIKKWPASSPLPELDFVCVSFDTAFTEHDWDKKRQQADPTAMTIWGVFHDKKAKRNCILLLDAKEDYVGFDDLRKWALEEAKAEWGTIATAFISGHRVERGKRPDVILVEAKASGISLIQTLQREGVPVDKYDPGRVSKVARLHMVSHLFAQGVIYVPESKVKEGEFISWATPMLEQLCAFAGEGSTKHDDWVDSTTQALILMMKYLDITVTKKSELPDDGLEPEEPVKPAPAVNPYM